MLESIKYILLLSKTKRCYSWVFSSAVVWMKFEILPLNSH